MVTFTEEILNEKLHFFQVETLLNHSQYNSMTFFFCYHCVKIVQLRIFSDPYFPSFRLNMEIYGVTYSFQVLGNTDQKNSVFGHFSHSLCMTLLPLESL